MAYFVRKGQEVVIEVDGGDRDRIILVAIVHSQSQKRRKLMLTLNAVLGIWQSKGWENPLINEIAGRWLTDHCRRR